MATYSELLGASQNALLLCKVKVACIIAAELIRAESSNTSNHVNRLKWSKACYNSPDTVSRSLLWAVLAQNAAAPINNILNATDAAVQTAVNTAIDIFADGN